MWVQLWVNCDTVFARATKTHWCCPCNSNNMLVISPNWIGINYSAQRWCVCVCVCVCVLISLVAVDVFKCFQFFDQRLVLVLQHCHSVLQTLHVLLFLPPALTGCLSTHTHTHINTQTQ